MPEMERATARNTSLSRPGRAYHVIIQPNDRKNVSTKAFEPGHTPAPIARFLHGGALPVAQHPGEGWWEGRDNSALPEPALSHKNYLKTRRLPHVGSHFICAHWVRFSQYAQQQLQRCPFCDLSQHTCVLQQPAPVNNVCR